MSIEQPKGGASPAITAHSKDGSTAGLTTPSSAMEGGTGTSGSTSDVITGVSTQAREAVKQIGASAADAAGTARKALSEGGGRAVEQTSALVREQPFAALMVTGALCLALGILLGRR
jgi:ElaB/YqjD/DUF883 family membrane-anchored ribosome-binding protein